MQNEVESEVFATGLSKIRHEIKSQLASHGLYGTITNGGVDPSALAPPALNIAVTVKGREATRSFERGQIESCHLRVERTVLADITAMVDDLAR